MLADHCETLAPSISEWCREAGMRREEGPQTMGLLRKATKSQRLTSKEPLVSKPVLWLELDTLFPWV